MLDIGDKEGTLCESNEELHRLLLERQIPHEWEVRSEFGFHTGILHYPKHSDS